MPTNEILAAAVENHVGKEAKKEETPIKKLIATLKKAKVPKGATIKYVQLDCEGFGSGWATSGKKHRVIVGVERADGWKKQIIIHAEDN